MYYKCTVNDDDNDDEDDDRVMANFNNQHTHSGTVFSSVRCHLHVAYMIMHREPSLSLVPPRKHRLATLSAAVTV